MSQERIELRCPDCGAPLPAAAATSAVTCERCGTASHPAPKGPEKVVQTIVVERVVLRDDAQTTPCPRCRVGLFAVQASGVTVQGCGVCGGIWLDNEGSIAIISRDDSQIAALAGRAERSAAIPRGSSPARVDCPICKKQMERIHTAQRAELDICREHGTWFDAGELRRVMSAYHSSEADMFTPITGPRDLVGEQLAAVAAANAPPPEPWTFNGPRASKIVDGGVAILGAILAGALSAPPPRR